MSPYSAILLILRDALKNGPEFDRRLMVRVYELAELLDSADKNLVNEIAALTLTLMVAVPRQPGALVSGDAGFNRPSVTVATLHGN